MRFIKIPILIFFFNVTVAISASSQEINFGNFYGGFTVDTFAPFGTNLNFGLLVENSGVNSLSISDAVIIEVTGIRYLDVNVSLSADQNLSLGGNPGCTPPCTIPFTLEAAYTNLGTPASIAQALPINISSPSNLGSAQFPILLRTSGPPGPPPTPIYEGFDPSVFNETATLYIFGSTNVGAVTSGSYSATVVVTVSYN